MIISILLVLVYFTVIFRVTFGNEAAKNTRKISELYTLQALMKTKDNVISYNAWILRIRFIQDIFVVFIVFQLFNITTILSVICNIFNYVVPTYIFRIVTKNFCVHFVHSIVHNEPILILGRDPILYI